MGRFRLPRYYQLHPQEEQEQEDVCRWPFTGRPLLPHLDHRRSKHSQKGPPLLRSRTCYWHPVSGSKSCSNRDFTSAGDTGGSLTRQPHGSRLLPLLQRPRNEESLLGIIAATGPMDQLDKSRLPLLLSHFPGGTSVKLVLHWLQLAAKANGYRVLTTGRREIWRRMERVPPLSMISLATVCQLLSSFSPADTLVNDDSIKQALSVIPQCAIVRARNLTGFGHFDFLWGTRARRKCITRIIKEMKRIE
ncbi:hypothetical protein PENTCL1PPCAC_30492, partial [Pristionchus entomophagus]